MDAINQKRALVQGVEKKSHFSNCFISSSTTDGRLMAINDKYLAIAYIGKGNIKLLDSSQPINLMNNNSKVQFEDSNILDMEFSPFDSDLLCFSNENNHVFLSRINYLSADNIEFNSDVYQGHEKKVNFINFNPIASNVMVSSTSFGDIHIWESKEFKTYNQFKLAYNPSNISWSPNGDLIGITAKNKILTIYDPRKKNAVFQEQISQNSLVVKFAWLDNNTVATVGFNKKMNKELSLIDIRKSNSYQYDNISFSAIEIDKYTSTTTPFVNQELKLIYCVGKEEKSIKIFDYYSGKLLKNNDFIASDQNLFSVFLNRQYLNKSKMEVDRFARYTKNKNIYYVSFNLLPEQNFDGILYPSEDCSKPQMNSNDWIIGKKFERISTKVYHKRPIQSSNYQVQNNEQNSNKETNNSKNKFFQQFININEKDDNSNNESKYSNYTSKNSNFSQQKDYEELYKKFEIENKSLTNKNLDLQKKLKEEENENKALYEKLKTKEENENNYNNNISEINRLKKIIQDKEKKYQDLLNENRQKEERSSKNIANLKAQINEKILLIKKKDKEILSYTNLINNKDNTIKVNQSKIQLLEEEKKNYLQVNDEINQKFELSLAELSKVQEELDNLKNEQDTIINNSKLEFEEEKKVLENNISELNIKYENINNKYHNEQKLNQKLSKENENYKEIKNNYEKIQKENGEKDDIIMNLNQDLNEKENLLKKYIEDLNKSKEDLNNEKKEKIKLKNGNNKLTQVNLENQKLKKQNEVQSDEIEKLKEDNKLKETMNLSLNDEIQRINKEKENLIQKLNEAKKNYEEEKTKNDKERENIEKNNNSKIQELTNKIKSYENQTSQNKIKEEQLIQDNEKYKYLVNDYIQKILQI